MLHLGFEPEICYGNSNHFSRNAVFLSSIQTVPRRVDNYNARRFFLGSHLARATVTPVGYWRMGESDAGAANGVTATNVADLAGAHPLKFQGAAAYSADVSPSATYSTGSSLSVNFTSSAYATNTVVSTAVDNFGIECWVKPTASGATQVIAYNGNTGTSGWGLIVSSTNSYQALIGGKVVFGTALALPNIWTHLALVRAGGTATLYVNGVATATAPNLPAAPAGNFAVASTPQTLPGQAFTGLVDEVRVFTFAAGQFSTNDLLFQRRTLVVTNSSDSGAGSLRDTLAASVDSDVINIVTNGVITLGSELTLNKSVTINGPGAANLKVSGNQVGRVFNVYPFASVTISGLTVCDGRSAPGGGIFNYGNLVMNSCMISNNSVVSLTIGDGQGGGGIYNIGSIVLNSCTLCNNRAGDGGLGFSSIPTGSGGHGGAIYTTNSAVLVQCTLFNNSAGTGGSGSPGGLSGGGGAGGPGGLGGAIAAAGGTLQLITCTVAMNNPGAGGPGGSDLMGNTGSPGPSGANGGIANFGSQVSLINTIVGANNGGGAPDVAGAFTSLGHNLIGTTNGAIGFTNGVNGDVTAGPGLGAPGFYGGPAATRILTLLLLPGSPALNAGDDAILSPPYQLTVDERGLSRKVGAHVDIGAYESDVIFSNAVVTTLPTTPFEDPIFGYWSATLPGAVNPGGYPSAVYFDYGTTPGYGLQTPVGTLALLNFSNNPVSATLSNLIISQTYHYRVVASNSAGVFTGSDLTFTITPPAAADSNGDGSVDASELATVLSHLGTNRVSLSNVNQVLLNYLNGDPLLMTNVAGLGSSNVTFGLSNSPAINFTVQSSTNLTNWQTLGPAQLLYRFTDTNTPLAPNRQYRLVYP